MSHQYASKQPSGYKNYIENVAIVGAGGQMGSHIVRELLKIGKHKITAITREDSTNKMPEGVEVKKVNYDNQSSLVEALKGQDALIITMNVMAGDSTQDKLIRAAAEAGVPWVLPNEWGVDSTQKDMQRDIKIGEGKAKSRALIEELGKSAWISMVCGFWYEYSLAVDWAYGIDINNRVATFFDDGKTAINTSTWPHTALATAKLLSSKVLPDDENDESLCLNMFRNKTLYISSFTLSQRDMLDSIMRVTNTTEKDWTIKSEPVKERYQAGVEQLNKGDRLGFGKMLYSRVFYPDGCGNFERNHGTHNKLLGLPDENLDEYTKIAVERSKTSPF